MRLFLKWDLRPAGNLLRWSIAVPCDPKDHKVLVMRLLDRASLLSSPQGESSPKLNCACKIFSHYLKVKYSKGEGATPVSALVIGSRRVDNQALKIEGRAAGDRLIRTARQTIQFVFANNPVGDVEASRPQ